MGSALPVVFVIAGGLCLAMVLLALWQSLRGLLLRGSNVGSAPREAGRERLLHEKQELLTAIRDVRLEHELGKVSDADFARLEQGYRARAREVLRELEAQLEPFRAAAQQMLAQAVGSPVAAQTGAAAVAVPAATPAASTGSSVSTAGTCGRCGASNDADAVFCKKCGERVSTEQQP